MGLGIHRRSFLEAAIYAARRAQFGQRIDQLPARARDPRRPAVDLEAGLARRLRVRIRVRGRSGPGIRAACAADLDPACEAPLHPGGTRSPPPPRSRSSAATATWRTGRWPASSATPSATQSGRAPRTSAASTSGAAMRGEHAHIALLERVERALDSASGVGVLARPVDTSSQRSRRHPHRGRPPRHRRRRPRSAARRGASQCFSRTSPREHSWLSTPPGHSDATVTPARPLVARRFCERRLTTSPVRGILDTDRSVMDLFEPLVRYGRIEASDLVA